MSTSGRSARGEAEPLDCDESAYAYIGRRLVRGDVLYRDLTENKPPGGYWLYALAVALGGANEQTIRFMPLPFVLATLGLVWWLGLRLRGRGAAASPALTYAIVSTDPYLFGNGANMEHFLNLFSDRRAGPDGRVVGPDRPRPAGSRQGRVSAPPAWSSRSPSCTGRSSRPP